MSNTNSITLIGNLTRDPELRYTTGGRGVASFGLAVSRRWMKDGEWQEQSSFFNVVCWGDLGENVASTLSKGARAFVFGRLEQRSWETQDGEKKSVVEVVADDAGPSLRWATAQVERNERTNAPASGGGGASKGAPSRPADPVYGDEEPF